MEILLEKKVLLTTMALLEVTLVPDMFGEAADLEKMIAPACNTKRMRILTGTCKSGHLRCNSATVNICALQRASGGVGAGYMHTR